MARQFLNITYPSPNHPDYKRVIELVKNTNTYKSEVGRRLVHRGLEHLGNPHGLFEDTKATSPVEVTQEKPVVRTVNPTVNSSVEHVSGEQSPKHLAGDQQLLGDERADRKTSSAEALDKKESPEEDKSNAGWILLGILGAGFATWLIHKLTTKVDQIGVTY